MRRGGPEYLRGLTWARTPRPLLNTGSGRVWGRLLVAMAGAPATLYGWPVGRSLATGNSSLSRKNYRFGSPDGRRGERSRGHGRSLQATVEVRDDCQGAMALGPAARSESADPVKTSGGPSSRGYPRADQVLRPDGARSSAKEKAMRRPSRRGHSAGRCDQRSPKPWSRQWGGGCTCSTNRRSAGLDGSRLASCFKQSETGLPASHAP